MSCPHDVFGTEATVSHDDNGDAWARVRIVCRACREPFSFTGLGKSKDGPHAAANGAVAVLPIRPASELVLRCPDCERILFARPTEHGIAIDRPGLQRVNCEGGEHVLHYRDGLVLTIYGAQAQVTRGPDESREN